MLAKRNRLRTTESLLYQKKGYPRCIYFFLRALPFPVREIGKQPTKTTLLGVTTLLPERKHGKWTEVVHEDREMRQMMD